MEDNLCYLRLEHSKLQEEVAALLTRLLTAATEANRVKRESRVKKWWQFWRRQAENTSK